MDGNSSMVSLPPLETWKTCRKCGGSFPLSYFHRKSKSKDGRQATCKDCKSKVDKARTDRMKAELKENKLQEKCQQEKLYQEVRASVLGPKSIDALYSLLDRMEAEERKTLQLKGNDYSGDNRLANFERIGAELDMDPAKVLWIYFKKHTDRLRTYITEGAVSSESVVDSIMDCRNYMALLRLMIEAKA